MDMLVLLGYLVLALILSWPLLTHFSSHVVGYGDVWQHLWNWWWVRNAVVIEHVDPYFSPYIFHPDGVGLAGQCFAMLYKIPALPIQGLFGRVVLYNFVWLLSYVLSGYGAYRLGLYLTRDRQAAFLTGLCFAFSAFHVYHVWSHLNNLEWLPFAVLSYVKLLRERKWVHGCYAGMFVALATLCSWYYLLFLLLFLFLLLLSELACRPRTLAVAPVWAGLGLSFLVGAVILAPFVYPVVRELGGGATYFRIDVSDVFSADLAAFFTVGRDHPWFGRVIGPLYERFRTHHTENVAYLGWPALFLCGYAFFRENKREVWRWLFLTVAFAVFCCGPYPQLFGRIYRGVPLPFFFLDKIGLLKTIRAPIRFLGMAALGVSVLAGFGYAYIRRQRPDRQTRVRLFVFCCLVVFLDSLAWFPSFPLQDTAVSPFYERMGEDTTDYAILDVPLPELANPWPLYTQGVHKKRMIGGYVSRTPPAARRFLESIPNTCSFITRSGFDRPDMPRRVSPAAAARLRLELVRLRLVHVRYAVIQRGSLDNEPVRAYADWLASVVGAPVFQDKEIAVYDISRDTPNAGSSGIRAGGAEPSGVR